MNTGTLTAVGIDVSKHKSTVAARRPGGEVVLLPFDVEHTADGLKKLIAKLRQLDGEIRCKCQRKSEPGAHEKVSHKRPRKSEPERSRIVDPVC